MTAFADEHERDRLGNVRHRPDQEIDALVALEARHRQDIAG